MTESSASSKLYTFFKRDGRGESPFFELVELETPGAARTYAAALLKSPTGYSSIDVWVDDRHAFTLKSEQR